MPQVFGKTQVAVPTKSADGVSTQLRCDEYGGAVLAEHTALRAGKLFRAINATPGTGIAASATTAFSATAALLTLYNGESAGGLNLIPQYVRLINTAVAAATTRIEGVLAVDTVNRYSSGGTALTSNIKNPNTASSAASNAVIRFGDVVAAAESAARRVSRFQLRNAIMTQYEEYVIAFGGLPVFGDMTNTNGSRHVVPVSGVQVAPGHSAVLHIWYPGAGGAPSWEVEVGWLEV